MEGAHQKKKYASQILMNGEYTRNVRVLLERFGETGAASFTTPQQAAARFHHRYDHMQHDHDGQRVERLDVLTGVRRRVFVVRLLHIL